MAISDRLLSLMLTQHLEKSSLAIIGYQTLTGQLILQKLANECRQLPTIFAVEVGKDSTRRNAFLAHPFLNPQQQTILRQSLQFCTPETLSQKMQENKVEKLNTLMVLYEPCDFSNMQKVAGNHLYFPSLIASHLVKAKIERCVMLSSIYCREAGYLSQEEEADHAQIIKTSFETREEGLNYLKDTFETDILAWRWSILFMERVYGQVCDQLTVVRVPALGPTITHSQGHTLKFNFFTYLTYQLGAGLLTHIDGKKQIKIDLVPNDYVSNFILVLAAKQQQARTELLYLSTTTRNFVTLENFVKMGSESWQVEGKPNRPVQISESQLSRKWRQKRTELPSKVKKRLGNLLDVKSWKIEGTRAAQEQEQKQQLLNKYRYFLEQEWLCESIKSIDLFGQLTPQEQEKYHFNVNSIQWAHYIRLCVFGIRRHLLRQKVEDFNDTNMEIAPTSKSYFSDIMWALNKGKSAEGLTRKSAVDFVLNSKSVKDAIKNQVDENMMKLQNAPVSYEKATEELTKVAEDLCVQMFSDYSMNSIRMFGWFLHKVFSTIYDRVIVDQNALARLRNRNDTAQGPLVIIPTHRSYIDFLIMGYVCFGSGIKLAHIAAAEDFLNMAVVHVLLRRSGAFFIKRNQKKHKQLYKAIMKEYMTSLIGGNHYLEFFIEGTRSRTGKMLAPKFGMLSLLMRDVAQGRVNDVQILPVTVNYERVLEGESFTYEMMGQTKVKQSLSRLVKAVDVLKENYGRIYLELCPTFSVKQWLHKKQGSFDFKVSTLGDAIVQSLIRNVVISEPAVVATIVLMHRRGISEDSLQEKARWLCTQINSRGVRVGRNQGNSSISLGTMGLLAKVLQKSKKDMFEVEVKFDQSSFVQLFTLTYYRNTLAHIFFQQAIIVTALTSFGHENIVHPKVTLDSLNKRSLMLWKMLENEFYLPDSLNDPRRFNELIQLLQKKGVIKVQDGCVIVHDISGNFYSFYWSLVWPVVQSYWAVCLYLFKLLKSPPISADKLNTELQWFSQSLINEHLTVHPESISADTIKNAVACFKKHKIIGSSQAQRGTQTVPGIKLLVGEDILLKTKETLELFLKRNYAKSIKGLVDGAVSIDFPFLSKL